MKKLVFTIFIICTIGLTIVTRAITGSETIGFVEGFDGENIHIIGEAITKCAYEDVIVNITNNTHVYDLLTGFRVGANAIYEGMSARASYIVGRSEPFDALAVWLNWDSNNAAVFSVAVSGNIQYSEDSCVFISNNGKYRVTISPETAIICPQYGLLSHMDILPGQEFFVWVDMITASNPAEVYPDKIVLME